MDVAHRNYPSGSRALLASGTHGATDRGGDRHIEVRVSENDARVVSAQFQLDAAVSGSDDVTDALTYAHRPGERDPIDPVVGHDGPAHRSGAEKQIQHTVRYAGVGEQAGNGDR